MSGGKSLDFLLMVVLGAALVVAGIAAVTMAFTTDVASCSRNVSGAGTLGQLLAIVAVLSFLAGRALGYFRRQVHAAPAIIETGEGRPKPLGLPWFLQSALAIFLIIVTVFLAYETLAVAGFRGWYPITSYVRCAAGSSPLIAAIGTASLAVLLGNWLWYPTDVEHYRERRRRREGLLP